MNIKLYIYISFLALVLSSCENEINETNETISKQTLNDAVTLKNGRLSFQNKESFALLYKEYAEASEEKLIKYFQPLYEKGFYSLRPIVNENNEEFLYNHYIKLKSDNIRLKQSKNLKSNSENDVFDYLDDLEEIIGDDTFAAFLNNDAEILIGNDVYKYSDVGLFIVDEDEFSELENYLDSKNLSKDINNPTPESYKALFYEEVPCGGMVDTIQINEDVSYFSNNPCDGGGYSSTIPTTYTPTAGSAVTTDPSYNSFFNNLSSCNPHSGLFGNLFGDNDVCIDKYESKRRVKTKAFNYDYLLVFHLGVKCVHQYKGWTGFWRVEATDEIRLVVEAAQFQYDLNALTGNTAINNQTKERYYFMNNQKIIFAPSTYTLPNWGSPSITYYNKTSLPPIFQDDLSFEFFSTGWSWLDGQIQNGIDSNLKATKLNDYFYDALYSTITSQLKTALGNSTVTPANRTFVAKFPEQGKLIFQKSVLNQGFGIGVREKTFDWGAEFSFNASTSGSNGWRLSGGPGSIIARPSNFRVKIIGAARRGNSWHGSKFNVGIN